MHEVMSGPGQRIGAWLQRYGAPPGNLTPLLAARHAVRRHLHHRVARPAAVDLKALLGGWPAVAVAVPYGGGPLVAAACWLAWWHRTRRWQVAAAARAELQP